VPARARATVDTSTIAALTGASFATTLESDAVVVLDRLMSWSGAGGYAAHMETAVEQPATTWYLAEGATHGVFDLFYLIQNPGSIAADIRVRYLRPSGAPIVKTYQVAPRSRHTIWVNEVPGLASGDVSAAITSSEDIAVERAMYGSPGGQVFGNGTNATGTRLP